ncbi:MAG TPA: hypothetical protein VK054_05190, partial [Beutenbergiaceae bacterium]|nr:hypothetical protein [Beutenbergiaceae bacterium]
NNADDSANWTTTLPSDPSDVWAVRVVYKNADLPYRDGRYLLQVDQQIKEDVGAGQDIWMWSDYRILGTGVNGGKWAGADLERQGVTRGDEPGTNVGGFSPPGYRYPAYGHHRDVLRTVIASPQLHKETDQLTAMPNSTGSYTLEYRAEVPPSAGTEVVDDFTIIDTLPAGVTYVDGSASIAPDSVDTDADGIQTITWVIDGVDVNTDYELTYDVAYGPDVEPGSVLENVAEAALGGLSSGEASATVAVADSGTTSILKQAHDDLVGLRSGFNGTGGWTVSVVSDTPTTQNVVDVIDVLPFEGDNRGTVLEGELTLDAVDAPSGAQVYYTTHDPTDLSDDPN